MVILSHVFLYFHLFESEIGSFEAFPINFIDDFSYFVNRKLYVLK